MLGHGGPAERGAAVGVASEPLPLVSRRESMTSSMFSGLRSRWPMIVLAVLAGALIAIAGLLKYESDRLEETRERVDDNLLRSSAAMIDLAGDLDAARRKLDDLASRTPPDASDTSEALYKLKRHVALLEEALDRANIEHTPGP